MGQGIIKRGFSGDHADLANVTANQHHTPTVLNVKVAEDVRDTSLGSGTQAFVGLGFQPKAVIFFVCQNNSGEASWGADDGDGSGRCIYKKSGSFDYFYADFSIYDYEDAGKQYQGRILSLDVNGFTISWTRVSTPTGTITVRFLAIG